MKKILICLFAFGSLLCGSCSDWLEVYPKNEQKQLIIGKQKKM